jgi:glycosyltransferase involved in cell wall biosynthesis
MFNIRKAVTCHAGARDGYYLSSALNEVNSLEALVTDFYTPDILSHIIKGRHSTKLPSRKTISLLSNLLRQRALGQNFLTTDKILSSRAFQVARQTKSNLFLTSYTAYEAFRLAQRHRPDMGRLLFQIHPHPIAIRKILTEELLATPEAEFSILAEHEMQVSDEMLARLDGESQLADSIVVASSFTKKTLIDSGVESNKISILPYGVDAAKFPQKLSYSDCRRKLKIVFVGQMVQRKGLSYLLKAVKALHTNNIELTVVGRGRIDEHLLKEYATFVDFNIIRGLSHEDLVKCFHEHDVLVLPSLVEGFGHVILEAMSAGLPVICTKNTAGPDLFLTGDEGIVVPIRDSEAISNSIEELMVEKGKVEFMGRQASFAARDFTWERHCEGIKQFYLEKS